MWGALTKKSNTSFDAHSFMQIRISSSSQRHFSLSSPCSETAAENPIKMDGADWRSQLRDDSRQRIVNKIMETLKRHVPISGPEGLIELRKIAVRFEEKIYSAATSQTDYLRKISLKMLTMETKSQNLTPNAAGVNQSQPYQGQMGYTNVVDWQEEAFQKIKSMKELYLPELINMHQEVCLQLQQPEYLLKDQFGMTESMKVTLERTISFLQVSKSLIPPYKDKLPEYEKNIINFLAASGRVPFSAVRATETSVTSPIVYAPAESTNSNSPMIHTPAESINSS